MTQQTISVDSKNVQMKKLDKLAWWLDSSIRIPGTSWRVGLDGIIGLVPGIGDVSAGAISSYILMKAVKMKVPITVIIRMTFNILLESAVGTIPVIGDWFDFAYKANKRNVNLMQDYLTDEDAVTTRSTFTVAIVVCLVIALIISSIWLIWKLIALLIGAL